MDQLWYAASTFSRATAQPERPDLDLPAVFQNVPTAHWLELRDLPPPKGKGYVARTAIAAGTLLLVSKPIGMVMDWEDKTKLDDNEQDAATATNGGTVSTAPSTVMDAMEEETEGGEDDDDDEVPEEVVADDDDDDDVEDDGKDDDDEKDPYLNELLLLDVLDQMEQKPSLWTDYVSNLYPRTAADVASLPAWVCNDDEIFVEIESAVQELAKQPVLEPHVKEISKRLPLIIRYNILSVETGPELLSYSGPEGMANLAGIGLYYEPSFFNHARRPNCSRYAVGDVMFFVANQDIAPGTEVCISYMEHDVLCESAYRRNQMLSMNFDDSEPGESPQPTAAEEDGPDLPVVDSDVQNELMAMDLFERLSAIEELLTQASGDTPAGEGVGIDAMDETQNGAAGGWYSADVQNLRILKALTLEGLGQTDKAFALWEESVLFAETRLPPYDEHAVIMHVQAAMSAWQLRKDERAREHAAAALRIHNHLFGGGMGLLRVRLGPDLRLDLRPNLRKENGLGPMDILWPL